MTWSCKHLGDSSWCSPSGKGRRRRFCHLSCRSLRSRSWWHHFLDSAGRWGNPRRTAPAARDRKAGLLGWTLGGEGQRDGANQSKSKRAVWLMKGMKGTRKTTWHETNKQAQKTALLHWSFAGVLHGNLGVNSDLRTEHAAWQTTPREYFTTQPQTLS